MKFPSNLLFFAAAAALSLLSVTTAAAVGNDGASSFLRKVSKGEDGDGQHHRKLPPKEKTPSPTKQPSSDPGPDTPSPTKQPTTCAAAGDSCKNAACCSGLVCPGQGGNPKCTADSGPDTPSPTKQPSATTCTALNQSCRNAEDSCCSGLACTGNGNKKCTAVPTPSPTSTCYKKSKGLEDNCPYADSIKCFFDEEPQISQIVNYPDTGDIIVQVAVCENWDSTSDSGKGCCHDGYGGYYALVNCGGSSSGGGACCPTGETNVNGGNCVPLTCTGNDGYDCI